MFSLKLNITTGSNSGILKLVKNLDNSKRVNFIKPAMIKPVLIFFRPGTKVYEQVKALNKF